MSLRRWFWQHTLTGGAVWPGGVWFRLLGFGVRVADLSRQSAIFTDLDGTLNVIRLGRWSIRPLYRRRKAGAR